LNFASCQYIGFLLGVWALFLIIPAPRRSALLLVASYVFYAAWSLPFIGVILITTSIDYFASRKIDQSDSQKIKRAFLWTAILANLFVLCVFKYLNFFLDAQCSLFTLSGHASLLPSHLNILLPLGISYYTFEAISYLVDVYRGMQPAPSWGSYNFYIMYFPHLLSGPIVRFKELYSQYEKPIQLPSADRLAKAAELIILGFFCKLAIADSIAPIVDPIYADASSASTLSIFIGGFGFITQLYFDFLGYTHVARGSSLLFNIELPVNFDHPFHSTNMANFWQRWQISLSRWLHDYVFQPLGGARRSLRLTVKNVFLTLLIAGIWHGAGWNYILLGAYFGATAAFYHAYRRYRKSILKGKDRSVIEHPIYAGTMSWITFYFIVFSGILFRAQSLETIRIFFGQMVRFDLLARDIVEKIQANDLAPLGILLSCIVLCRGGPLAVRLYQRFFERVPYAVKIQAATMVAVLTWVATSDKVPPFIYFQF
jgi:alginate O-acetyltransferase complex protein AlgI